MKLTEITVTRTIPAPAEEVFDVWMDSKSPGGPWFGAERVIVNTVVDGLFYIAVKYEERIWPHFGRFIRIDRPRLVEHTWMSEGTKGAESVVTVTMEPRGDETNVTLQHTGVPDDEMGRQHEEGWTWLLTALAEAARRAATARLIADMMIPRTQLANSAVAVAVAVAVPVVAIPATMTVAPVVSLVVWHRDQGRRGACVTRRVSRRDDNRV